MGGGKPSPSLEEEDRTRATLPQNGNGDANKTIPDTIPLLLPLACAGKGLFCWIVRSYDNNSDNESNKNG